MDPQQVEKQKEEVSKEMFDTSFDELSGTDRQRVGGKVGGSLKGGDMADPDRAPEPPKVKFGAEKPQEDQA